MVARLPEGLVEEADLIAAEALEERTNDADLASRLRATLRHGSHDGVSEEIKHFLIVQDLCSLPADLAEHNVPLLVLERVVQAGARDRLQAVYEWHCLFHTGFRNHDIRLAGHRIE